MRFTIHTLFLAVVIFLLALPHVAHGQKKYTLSGQVKDSLTGKPIKRAVVVIAGTKYNDTSNADGFYKIPNLVAGTNNLLIWAAGYDTVLQKVVISGNTTENVKLLANRVDTPAAAKDSIAPAGEKKIEPQYFNPPKEKRQKGITEEDKETMRQLIEDAVFSKSLYFSKMKDKKKAVYLEGIFTIDTGYIYEFEAKFNKKDGGGFELAEFSFELKGRAAFSQ